MSWASSVIGVSVVIACATMRTLGLRLWRLAKSRETTMAAAAPQVGGQAIGLVITPGQTTGDSRTCSVVITLRKTDSGLLAAWRLALARTFAKSASVVPYFCMCARP